MTIGRSSIGLAAIGLESGPPGFSAPSWIALIQPSDRIIYKVVLSADGFADLDVPMSSWQATVQSGAQSYLQAVIPAATEVYSDVLDRQGGTFTVSRCVALGATSETECQVMASAPLSTIRYDRGATNASVTISGYWTEEESAGYTATLTDVRTTSITSTTRVRTAIDWALRPGHVANAGDQTIDPVRYINYYVSPLDEYMDVGD